MKSIIKNQKSKIKNRFFLFAVIAAMLCSCLDFLDVVPDNTASVEDYFVNRESAYNALSNVYGGIPRNHIMDNSQWLLGDDWLGQRSRTINSSGLYGTQIMEGLQNTNNPLLCFWTGRNGANSLYERIRMANLFLEHIDLVADMSQREKDDWSAQVNFLKAYFHFILILHYGPIVIADENLSLNSEAKDLFQNRTKVDECFDYVITMMTEAIKDLEDGVMDSRLGMVNKAVAKSIKARVLLFRASPLFNGPKDLFSGFNDHDGQPFFPMDDEGSPAWRQKWLDAEIAVNDAIAQCLADGFDLYEFEGHPYKFDSDVWRDNYEVMKIHYDLRMLIVDPWNKELIWGRTYNPSTENGTIQDASNFRLPAHYATGTTETAANSYNWGSATFQAMNRYYTKNGLPIDVDRTFDRNNMFRLVITPDSTDLEYKELAGIMQPDYLTVKMYLEREPRFYANLGISGGYWRAHQFSVPVDMFGGATGGYDSRFTNDYYWTGIGVQKFVHPESTSGHTLRQIHFPYPIIRMAYLYLMRAEIMNELYGPDDRVYSDINKIRRRAGIPDVDKVWADPELVTGQFLNWHEDKNGLREIILRERAIEFAFEGSRYWDVVRYKRATSEFSTPVTGWIGDAFGSQNFFRIEVKQRRQFLNRNYFWPIPLNELDTNSNLIQNFGW